jgi:hypothetical protein
VESLRKAGLLALAIGAVGSVGLTLYTGRRNPSTVLMTLFVIWVSLPFVALAVADAMSKQWSAVTRTTLSALMLVVTFDTLLTYGYIAFGPSRPQPAFAFLVLPPASLLFSAIVLRAAAVVGRRRAQGDRV